MALTPARTTVINTDLNRDGDRNDRYVRGRLKRYHVAPDGHPILANPTPLVSPILGTESMNDDMVLAVAADGRFNAPLDNDGRPNGVFRCVDENGADVPPISLAAAGRAIEVTAWHGAFDDPRKNFMVRKGRSEAKWRNSQ